MLWRILWKAEALFLAVLVGCSTAQESSSRWSRACPWKERWRRGEQKLVTRYKAWCHSAQGVEGDCLGALVGGKYLDMQGRYMLAMALSKSPVLEEFQKALGDMVSMRAVLQAAIGTVVTLLVLLAMPEPVTKFVAAWATAALVLWVGAFTLYNLVKGWFELMEEMKTAATFDQIREAGEKFGRLFSREAAQAFATMAAVLERATCPSWRCPMRAPLARAGTVGRARSSIPPSALAVGAC